MSTEFVKKAGKPIIKSTLKEGITELPETWSRKAQTAVKEIERLQDVKKEELEFSEIPKRLAEMKPTDKVTKKDLLELEQTRPDKIGKVAYSKIPEKSKWNRDITAHPTGSGYRVNVYTFSGSKDKPITAKSLVEIRQAEDKYRASGSAEDLKTLENLLYKQGHRKGAKHIEQFNNTNHVMAVEGLENRLAAAIMDGGDNAPSMAMEQLAADGIEFDAKVVTDKMTKAVAENKANPGAVLPSMLELVDELAKNVRKATKRQTRTHTLDIPDAEMHARSVLGRINGRPARIIEEAQADVHQQGRRGGYHNGEPPTFTPEQRQKATDLIVDYNEVVARAAKFYESNDEQTRRLGDEIMMNEGDPVMIALSNLTSNRGPDVDELEIILDGVVTRERAAAVADEYLDMIEMPAGVPNTPHKDNRWVRNMLEGEIAESIEKQEGDIAVVISGGRGDMKGLKRGPGVQDFYIDTVAEQVKQIAKDNGMGFEMRREHGYKNVLPLSHAQELKETIKANPELVADYKLIRKLSNEPDAIDNQELRALSSKYGGTYLSVLDKVEDKLTFIANKFELEDIRHVADAYKRVDASDESMLDLVNREQGGILYAIVKPNYTTKKHTQSSLEAFKKEATEFEDAGEPADYLWKSDEDLVARYEDSGDADRVINEAVRDQTGLDEDEISRLRSELADAEDERFMAETDGDTLEEMRWAQQVAEIEKQITGFGFAEVSQFHNFASTLGRGWKSMADIVDKLNPVTTGETNPQFVGTKYGAGAAAVTAAAASTVSDPTVAEEAPAANKEIRSPSSIIIPMYKEFKRRGESEEFKKTQESLWSVYERENLKLGISKDEIAAEIAEMKDTFTKIDKSIDAGATDMQIAGFIDDAFGGDVEITKESVATEANVPTTLATNNDIPTAPEDEEAVRMKKEIDKQMIVQYLPPNEQAMMMLTDDSEQLTVVETLEALKVAIPIEASISGRVMGLAGQEKSIERSWNAANASAARIITRMQQDYGINIRIPQDEQGNSKADELAGLFGHSYEIENDAGEWVPLTDGLLKDMTTAVTTRKWEAMLNMSGALAGGAIAGKAYDSVIPPGAQAHPVLKFGKLLTVAGGLVIGGSGGGSTGAGLDYLHAANKLQQEIEGAAMAQQMKLGAEAGVIGEAVGGPAAWALFKALKPIVKPVWDGGKWVTRQNMRIIKKTADYIINGNSAGARELLSRTFFISEQELDDIVRQVESVGVKVPGITQDDKRIAATVMTQPGGEQIAAAASDLSFQTGQSISRGIGTRANQVLEGAKDIAGENAGKYIEEDLANYEQSVTQLANDVKDIAYDSPRANTWGFDMNAMLIAPLKNDFYRTIKNKDLQTTYRRAMENLYKNTTGRHLGDLLEVRELMVQMRNSKGFTATGQFNQMLKHVDDAIDDGARATLDEPEVWLKNYKDVKLQQAELHAVKDNALYTVLTKPGVTDDQIASAFTKYGPGLDDTMHRVMSKLPVETQRRAEGLVIDKLAEKYTAGMPGEMRATQFPMLAQQLERYRFTTPEARKYKEAILELADVFKNDVMLGRQSGQLNMPAFQSYLTTDPVVRMQFAAASTMFNAVMSRVPYLDKTKQIALVRKTASLLKEPTNAKAINELIEEAKDITDVAPQILQLAQAVARRRADGMDPTGPRVKLKISGTSTIGTMVKAGDTAPGNAISIPVHRIATLEEAEKLRIEYGLNRGDKMLDDLLKDMGYKAIQLGTEKARIL